MGHKYLGFYPDMPEEEYFAIRAFSNTGAKALKKSPEHFLAYENEEWKFDPGREFFKAVHLLMLEPENEKLVVIEGRRVGTVKERILEEKSKGKIVVNTDQFERAHAIAERGRKHKYIGPVLKDSMCEVSIFWIDHLDVYCKARLDIVNPKVGWVMDLKNFTDLTEWGMWSQANRMKYLWQLCHYSSGAEVVWAREFGYNAIIFCEDKAPFGMKGRTADAGVLARAEQDLDELKLIYKECLEKDEWPGYDEEFKPLDVPHWYFNE